MKLPRAIVYGGACLGVRPLGQNAGYVVGTSAIHGRGVFAIEDFCPADRVAIAFFPLAAIHPGAPVYGGTQVGRFVNHSPMPNITLRRGRHGSWVVVAVRPIRAGDELTSDYRVDCPKLRAQPLARYVFE